MKIALITQKLDAQDYVFGFFYGHVIDLASVCDFVHVVCLEKGDIQTLPKNVIVHSLGKEEGMGRWEYVKRLFKFFILQSKEYDTVLIHMEPFYVLMCGWWWIITRKRVVLWYNHIYRNYTLFIATLLVDQIVGVSKVGSPTVKSKTVFITHENDLTKILTGK